MSSAPVMGLAAETSDYQEPQQVSASARRVLEAAARLHEGLEHIEDVDARADELMRRIEADLKARAVFRSRREAVWSEISDIPDELDRSGEVCSYMQHLTDNKVSELQRSVHDTGVSAVVALLHAAIAGHHGVRSALEEFAEAFCGMSRPRDLAGEFAKILGDMLPKFVDEFPLAEDCDCGAQWAINFVPNRKATLIESIANKRPAKSDVCTDRTLILALKKSGYLFLGPKDCHKWSCSVCGGRRRFDLLSYMVQKFETDDLLFTLNVLPANKKTIQNSLSNLKCCRFTFTLADGGLLVICDKEVKGRGRETTAEAVVNMLIDWDLRSIRKLTTTGWALPTELRQQEESLFSRANLGKDVHEALRRLGLSPGAYVQGDLAEVARKLGAELNMIKSNF